MLGKPQVAHDVDAKTRSKLSHFRIPRLSALGDKTVARHAKTLIVETHRESVMQTFHICIRTVEYLVVVLRPQNGHGDKQDSSHY